MDQSQFKIRTSISTKLLLLISVILALPIIFLNLSAARLFKNDKIAYIYDSQATTTALMGREFVSHLESAITTLKLVTGSAKFNKDKLAVSTDFEKSIRFFLENQQQVLGIEVYENLAAINSGQPIARSFLPTADQLAVVPADVQKALGTALPGPIASGDQQIERKLASDTYFEKHGFFLRKIATAAKIPLLAIAMSGRSHAAPNHSREDPFFVGYMNLAPLLKGTATSLHRFFIADQTGSILFHSDPRELLKENSATMGVSVPNEKIVTTGWSTPVSAGAQEYIDQAGKRTLGSFYKPGLDLIAITQIDYSHAMSTIQALTEKFLALGLASFGVMIVIGLIYAHSLTTPIQRLFHATTQVATGNFEVSLPVTTRDEIGVLTQSFMAMSKKISDLVQIMIDKVRVDNELAIAQTVQQSLFPPNDIKGEQIHLSSLYQSASECGGDWLGYFQSEKKHSIIIADATGHGLPSALMTASARSCFSVIEKLVADTRLELNPAEMLSIANRVVYDSAQGKIMMTCFACVIDFEHHTISYSNAGHNPPWLFTTQSDGAGTRVGIHRIESLLTRGQRLGEHREISEAFEMQQTRFNKDDTLILYTDGWLEGKNTQTEQYGKKRARKLLENVIAQEPSVIVESLMTDFMTFNAGKSLDDDVTLAIARFQA